MRTFRNFSILFSLCLLTPAVTVGDTTYTDPRRPSFTLLVPSAWTIVRTDTGVDLKHGDDAEVTLFVYGKAIDPNDFMRNALPQVKQQHKDFRLIEQGACLFGRESGAYAIYTGVGPKGPALKVKLVTMTNGQLTYVMFEQAPPDKYEDEKGTMQRIQDSFLPESVGASQEGTQKLEALHDAGAISDEEYAARKRGEGVFRDARDPAYVVAVPAGWRALKNETGVKLEKLPAGAGIAQVWVQPQSNSPAAVLSNLELQMQQQLKQFRMLEQGEVRFGGLQGVYSSFTGLGTSGKPVLMKAVVTANGKYAFLMVMMADLDQYNAIKAEWDHIQQSFAIEGVGPHAGND